MNQQLAPSNFLPLYEKNCLTMDPFAGYLSSKKGDIITATVFWKYLNVRNMKSTHSVSHSTFDIGCSPKLLFSNRNNSCNKLVDFDIGSTSSVFLKIDEDKKQYLEITHNDILSKVLPIALLEEQGDIYTDETFSTFVLSPDCRHLLYVAENTQLNAKRYFEPGSGKNTSVGEKYLIKDNFGEGLLKKYSPTLYLFNTFTYEYTPVDWLNADYYYCDASWIDNNSFCCVGYQKNKFKLGTKYCLNRPSQIFIVSISDKSFYRLTEGHKSYRNPRISPNGKNLLYVENSIFGPHLQPVNILLSKFENGRFRTSNCVLNDVFVHFLTKNSFMCDNKFVLKCYTGNSISIFVLDLTSFDIKRISPKEDVSFSPICIKNDVILASVSSVCKKPCLLIGKFESDDVLWSPYDVDPDIDSLTIQSFSEEGMGYFFAHSTTKPAPLILQIHGGPHVVTSNAYNSPEIYTLLQLGFSMLFPNYRGSFGFTNNALRSLTAKVGSQDVSDCMFCLEDVLQKYEKFVDKNSLFVAGGSHGGFLSLHLIGQYPDLFKACIVRNPVTNLHALLTASDIPDWCLYEAAGCTDFSFNLIPTPDVVQKLQDCSPIRYVRNVKTPTIFQLGGVDARVPFSQGIQYYRSLLSIDVETKLYIYPEDGHPLDSEWAKTDVFVNSILWLKDHL